MQDADASGENFDFCYWVLVNFVSFQYKAWKEQILSSTPKEEQKNVIKRLKEEQVRKLQMLGEQYEQSIADMLQKQSVSVFGFFGFS